MLSPVSKFLSVQRKAQVSTKFKLSPGNTQFKENCVLLSWELRFFYTLFSSISALISTLNINILSFVRFFSVLFQHLRFWTNERSGQLKNNKMKAPNFNPNQLPSWPATFCVCNIILAISSTILVKSTKFFLYNLLEIWIFFFIKWQHQCHAQGRHKVGAGQYLADQLTLSWPGGIHYVSRVPTQ